MNSEHIGRAAGDSSLMDLGWSTFFDGARDQANRPELDVARVVADYGSAVRMQSASDSFLARARPDVCVGDWVLFAPPGGDERAIIEVVLARRSELARQAAGRKTHKQAVAANLDVVFVVTAMDPDFNPRRIDRYRVAVAGGGARAVVVLNKCDLALGQEGHYLRQLPDDVEVIVASADLGIGIEELRAHLGPGVTAGFVGSSGVGKSSLIRAVVGDDVGRVHHIRARDGRGQHTTTHREIYRLEGGGLVLDTPGMRELALWSDEGIDAVFADIVALAEQCRFRDCGHTNEPGCAVHEAIDAGELDGSRLDSWRRIQRQTRNQELRKSASAMRQQGKKFARMVRNVKKTGMKRGWLD